MFELSSMSTLVNYVKELNEALSRFSKHSVWLVDPFCDFLYLAALYHGKSLYTHKFGSKAFQLPCPASYLT